jgi:hypothetical protein
MIVSHATGSHLREASAGSSPQERRRSTRILARIGVTLTIGDDPPVSAIALDVSQHGGRLLAPISVRPRAVIWLQHERSGKWACARLVRASSQTPEGHYELGVEFLDGTTGSFWGDEFDDLAVHGLRRKC